MIFLIILLILSLLANGYQWYMWHSYRAQPAGNHSWTGMMPKISREQIEADKGSN